MIELIQASIDGSSMHANFEVIKKRFTEKYGKSVKVDFKQSSRFYGTVVISTEMGDKIEQDVVNEFRGIASHAVMCRSIMKRNPINL